MQDHIMRKSPPLHVLCATDGSPASRSAIELVQCFNLCGNSTLTLLYVSEFGVPYPKGLAALELPEDRGEEVLERIKRDLVSSDWQDARYEVLRGRLPETILLAANRHHVDLIAVGARGDADIQYYLMGSVARRVVMYASCPVLVVKKPVAALRRVVIGIDGSPEAEASAEFLLRLSPPEGTDVTVASVVPPFPHGHAPMTEGLTARVEQIRREVEDEARRGMTQVVEKFRGHGFPVDGVVVSGHPGQQLLKLVESLKADLIVVGSRGLTGDKRYLMGSVSDTVALYAPCAVLVVSQGESR
jgi:nucleotide-binding universal stress UspA family protein